MTVNYREAYGLFASSGILFNHESPLRGKEFVTRKITDAVARISLGRQSCLEIGNLDARRDWGYAKEYVAGMHKMLLANEPSTFVLATGRTETVRDFVRMSFQAAGIALDWHGQAQSEMGVDARTGEVRVRVNPRYYRPAEVDLLVGDPSLANERLGWRAETSLEQLCEKMMTADLRRVEHGNSW
jgi:GDPmannose 4,6-dehydratase